MDAAGVALLSAGITSVAGVVGAFVTLWLAPSKRRVDNETRRRIIVETASIADDVNQKRIMALHEQIEELSTLANTRYKRQLDLEAYLDNDIAWHRSITAILADNGIKIPEPPQVPRMNGGSK